MRAHALTSRVNAASPKALPKAHTAKAPGPARPEVRQILHAPGPQAKLTVGAPDDAFEKEADQVADQVMRMPEPGVQRMCSECEEEREKAGATTSEMVGELKAKAESGRTPRVPEGFQQRYQTLQGGGRALSPSERGFFEPRFAHDFGNVRLHTGPDAAELARSVQARAFTLGSSVVFGAGQYTPDSDGGRRLLAHELTHVVQQGGKGGGRVQRVVDFAAGFTNISLTRGAAATIGGSNFNYNDANFTADVTITATGDTVAELNQWDVGTLQDLVGHWDRYYWRRANADGRGRFVEKMYNPVHTRFRDQVNGTASVWYDDGMHQPLSGLASTPVGSRFFVTTTINHRDFPNGPETLDGSAQPGMDGSDGTRNVDIQRAGARFNTWASAQNTVTGEWRHIRFLNWNYMRSLDFSGGGGTLAVSGEATQLGRHGPHGGGGDAPLTAGTTYNTALNDPTLNPVRRVNGWT
ncbi:MAG: DUF4157 domain-containing protein [Thermoanaerobaculia bacterium]